MNTLTIDQINESLLRSYIETALWSSADEGTGLDRDHHCIDDIAPETLDKCRNDVHSFLEKAGTLLDGLDLDKAMHDFWLTRNHHGAGFWDGDYEESIGKALTDLSHTFGECVLYIGDDGLIHF